MGLAVVVTCAMTSTACAAEPVVGNVHSVYCQTSKFDAYVKFSTPETMTPGGGPVCYTDTGTESIDLSGVIRFWSGAHSGSFQYRDQPGLPIILRSFAPGQSERFEQPVEVLSLTINS
ncbi:MAG: hypothetical protein DLM60_15230 [Pseudonocardiales bacterium]|nr:MAG: hypothetical protein DLM60_15230 [Pseudonocardiales bacterium]